ncbi:MAG: PIN domain-containing protein [Firmicutes bacterium]|nr:PIN domain-containing protein [Bacillota bacterium]
MSVYVDTSAFLAVLDADDGNHEKAKNTWRELLVGRTPLICSSYVLVETWALVQNRLGMEAIKGFHEDILPLLKIEWVDQRIHQLGAVALIAANRRNLSLVDCVSFEIMRHTGIRTAFAFDEHFEDQGFVSLR